MKSVLIQAKMQALQHGSEAMRRVLLTLWVGSLWTVGYVVAPTLFITLPDRALAGMIAGQVFRVEAWLSLACGVGLLLLLSLGRGLEHKRVLLWLVFAMLLCTLLGYFGLQPAMAALKAELAPGAVLEGAARARFAWLHGVASLIYLIQSLLALALLWRSR